VNKERGLQKPFFIPAFVFNSSPEPSGLRRNHFIGGAGGGKNRPRVKINYRANLLILCGIKISCSLTFLQL
jgi:hypothetical protein